MQLDKQLYDEINDYCKLNNLKTRDFIHKILREAFNTEKYGNSPFAFNRKVETVVEEVKPAIEIKEEKVDITENDNVRLDMVAKGSNETFGSKILPVQAIPLPDKEPQVEPKKEEKTKVKKKRTLK